jgi:hypothetical protein
MRKVADVAGGSGPAELPGSGSREAVPTALNLESSYGHRGASQGHGAPAERHTVRQAACHWDLELGAQRFLIRAVDLDA